MIGIQAGVDRVLRPMVDAIECQYILLDIFTSLDVIGQFRMKPPLMITFRCLSVGCISFALMSLALSAALMSFTEYDFFRFFY